MIMNKYLNQVARLKERRIGSRTSNTDDLIDKEFRLVSSTITVDDELSVMDIPFILDDPFAFPDPIIGQAFVSGTVFELEETYQLFLKDYVATNFLFVLRLITDAAKADGVCLIVDSSGVNVSIERLETGYLIDFTFNIKDK